MAGQLATDISEKCSAFIFRVQHINSCSPGSQRIRHQSLLKCQKLFAKQHIITSQKTSIFSITLLRSLSLVKVFNLYSQVLQVPVNLQRKHREHQNTLLTKVTCLKHQLQTAVSWLLLNSVPHTNSFQNFQSTHASNAAACHLMTHGYHFQVVFQWKFLPVTTILYHYICDILHCL